MNKGSYLLDIVELEAGFVGADHCSEGVSRSDADVLRDRAFELLHANFAGIVHLEHVVQLQKLI